jgi:hypothetical protein
MAADLPEAGSIEIDLRLGESPEWSQSDLWVFVRADQMIDGPAS